MQELCRENFILRDDVPRGRENRSRNTAGLKSVKVWIKCVDGAIFTSHACFSASNSLRMWEDSEFYWFDVRGPRQDRVSGSTLNCLWFCFSRRTTITTITINSPESYQEK